MCEKNFSGLFVDIFGTTKLSPTLRLSFLAFLAFLVKIGAKIAGKIVIFDFLEFFFSDFGYQKKSNFFFFFFFCLFLQVGIFL